MTPQSQVKALAELDGNWIENNSRGGMVKFKDYFSYNIIIPLIQKQPKGIRAKIGSCPHGTTGMISVMTTPAQLCETLLRATGKWTDDE